MNPMQRSHVIQHVLNEYVDELGRADDRYPVEPEQDVLTDLLTDLRHYCEQHGLDFDYSVESSTMHWTAESSE